jgi:hypothetical protein
MQTRKKRSRKVLTILIAILSAALLTLLGGLFYRNSQLHVHTHVSDFTSCKQASGSVLKETYPEQCQASDGTMFTGLPDQVKHSPAVIQLQTYCAAGEKLCFDYPDNWLVKPLAKTDNQPGYTGDDVVVIDSTNTLPLELHTGMGGLGGACPDEARSAVYILASEAVANMNGFKSQYSLDQLRVAKVIVKDDSNNKYVATLYVTGDPQYTTDSSIQACGIFLSEFVYGRHAVESSESAGNLGAFRFGYTGFNPSVFYDSVDIAKKAYTSSVYEQAAAILASLRYQ